MGKGRGCSIYRSNVRTGVRGWWRSKGVPASLRYQLERLCWVPVNEIHIVCVCARVRARLLVCMCLCVRMCTCMCACLLVYVWMYVARHYSWRMSCRPVLRTESGRPMVEVPTTLTQRRHWMNCRTWLVCLTITDKAIVNLHQLHGYRFTFLLLFVAAV